jgi:hypothetical protein
MKEEPEWSDDGKCPYCNSSGAKRLAGYVVGAGKKGAILPSIESWTKLCMNPKCGKKFRSAM